MRRGLLLSLLLSAGAIAEPAADPQPDLVTKGPKAAKPAAPPPAAPESAPGAIPATGVEQKARRGVFVEATLGLFTTLGGSRFLSNGQPYLGLIFGTEVGESASVFASVGIGASSASCFDVDTQGNCRAADSFGATYLELGASYGGHLGPRTLLSGKIVAGLTNLSPGPVLDSTTRTVPDNLFGFHGGVGVAYDYDTHLDHFAVGLDLLARYTIAQKPGGGGSLGLASISVLPRLRYVF